MTLKMYKQINDAVSPVIGVMLMLVLTIILAAMVAAFSGGIMGEQNVAPQVALDVSYTASIIDTDKTNDQPDYRTGYTPNNGLTFRLIGGEAISLKDITLQLKNDDSTITFDSNVYRNDEYNVINTNSLNILTGSNGINETYFAVPTGQDFVITVGESFTILTDGYYDNTLYSGAKDKGKFLLWSPLNGGSFKVQVNVPFEYVIIDKKSGNRIQSGYLTIR